MINELLPSGSSNAGPSTRNSRLLSSRLRSSKVPPIQAQYQTQQQRLRNSDTPTGDGLHATIGAGTKSLSGRKSSSDLRPSQHPSQYPITALYAFQIAEIAHRAPPPQRANLEEGFTNQIGLVGDRPLDQQSSTIESRPVSCSKAAIGSASTPTTSERPSSTCSATSSEFSLTSALPPAIAREGSQVVSSQSGVGTPHHQIDSDSPGKVAIYESKRTTLTPTAAGSKQPNYNLVNGAAQFTTDLGLSTPTDISASRPKMKLGRKWNGRQGSKKVILKDSLASHSNVICSSLSDEEFIKPRLRTISSASHKHSRKSPPPPVSSNRKTRADIPPSPSPCPLTPRQPLSRQMARPSTAVSSARPFTTNMAEGSSSFDYNKSMMQLQVIRPPRSTRRAASPIRPPKYPERAPFNDQINEMEERPKTSFDYHDGIKWEMLNEVNPEEEEESTKSNGQEISRQVKDGANRWKTIEAWRNKARISSEDSFVTTKRAMHDEALWDETMRDARSSPSSSSSPPMVQSNMILVAADSLQSMSSVAPSLFTALSESPMKAAATFQKTQRPSNSPRTLDCSPKAMMMMSSSSRKMILRHIPETRLGSKNEEATTSKVPGTFPQIDSNYSLPLRVQRPSTGSEIIKQSRYPFPLQGESTVFNSISPRTQSVRSDRCSDVFESADEGEISHSSPLSAHQVERKSQEYSTGHLNAQKRASRLFGRREVVTTLSTKKDEDNKLLFRKPTFHLSTAQLMALSEEAESGALEPAELQSRHAQLLTRDEAGDDVTSESLPTPELSRLSHTSKEDDSFDAPKSPEWTLDEKAKENYFVNNSLIKNKTNKKGSDNASLYNDLASPPPPPPPPRPTKRRSRRISTLKGQVEEASSLNKPVVAAAATAAATFVKLDHLPIQLFETPTQSSWRNNMTVEQFEDFSKTFGSKEMHRQEVIEELSVTEWNFVISINSILRTFSLPLRNKDLSFQDHVPLEVARLFNWLDDILSFHVKLLKSLDKVKNRHPSVLIVCIAAAIGKHIQGLSIHQSYLVNFEKVTTLLEDIRKSEKRGDLTIFEQVVERQSRLPECRGMGLTSFLLKPIQRLMKYPLFFKQLAELTSIDHPDYHDTQELCIMTEKVIRDMNCVKAREEDYSELKVLEERVKGLPEDFYLASRQRRLLKQGSLKSVSLSEMDRLMMMGNAQSSLGHSPSSAPPTPPLPYIRPLGLSNGGSNSGFTPSPRLGSSTFLLSPDQSPIQTSISNFTSTWSPSISDASNANSYMEARNTSMYSTMTSNTSTSFMSEAKRNAIGQHPPPRPASRKTSMANLFTRGQFQSNKQQAMNEVEDETILHAFIFDDLLLLTTLEKEEDKETFKGQGRATSSKKKSGNTSKQSSPTIPVALEDNAKYTVLPRSGLSRILGVTNRSIKNGDSSTTALEVEVLPLYMVGDNLRSSGSSGSVLFVFAFGDDNRSDGMDLCSVWEKAFERSFLSCIQAQKRQTRYAQMDLSSPIFSALHSQRQQVATPTTAQTDWLRRKRHVTQVVNNAAKCGDRTTLTALLQAGLPFPRSPSQQNLSDVANRTVSRVEKGGFPSPPSPELTVKEKKVVKKSPSLSHLQSSLKRSPIVDQSTFQSNINTDQVSRVGDLGNSSHGARILDEERREEKTWWTLRLREIELEAEWNEELERLIDSNRSRVMDTNPIESPSSTRVRRGLPVVKPNER